MFVCRIIICKLFIIFIFNIYFYTNFLNDNLNNLKFKIFLKATTDVFEGKDFFNCCDSSNDGGLDYEILIPFNCKLVTIFEV